MNERKNVSVCVYWITLRKVYINVEGFQNNEANSSWKIRKSSSLFIFVVSFIVLVSASVRATYLSGKLTCYLLVEQQNYSVVVEVE